MRKWVCVPMMTLCLLLTACGGEKESEDLRERYRDMSGCGMTATVICCQEGTEWNAVLNCTYIPEGESTVEVVEPEEIAGVRAVIAETDWRLEYQDMVLNAGSLSDEEIKRKNTEIRISSARLVSMQGENKSMQSKLAYTTGQLQVRERDYAGLQDKLTRAEGELMVEKLSAAEMRARSEELGKTLKTAVTQLSAATAELNRVTKDKTIAETKLAGIQDITAKIIRESTRKRSDVIASYADSVLNFSCRVSEEKLFGLHTGSGSFFLPVVKFNGKNFIIGTLNKFAGDTGTALAFDRVKELEFTVQAPGQQALKKRLATPILVNRAEPLAAAFEYSGLDRKPLPLLTIDTLKNRGTDGLYLFKCTSLGKESTLLDGRCSLSLVPGENFMFIRNAGRANNELGAEPGDFVLSREGEFVGLVIGYETSERQKIKSSKVLLFADEKTWNDAEVIHINRKSKESYYEEFARKMQEIRKKIPADSRRR